jgi:hypothetical protein
LFLSLSFVVGVYVSMDMHLNIEMKRVSFVTSDPEGKEDV